MDFKEALTNIKNDMIEKEEVFEAIRRGYSQLENSSETEILEYFSISSAKELQGHVSNIKGILFEQEVQDKLTINGIESNIFKETNHPYSDLQIIDDNDVIQELQLKATNSASYINNTLSENPDLQIIATSEIANLMDKEEVINSEISNAVIEEVVVETLSPVSKTGIGLFGIGLLFGLPF